MISTANIFLNSLQPSVIVLLTQCVHESGSTLLMATVAFGDGADDWHAVIDRGWGLRRRVFVFRVAATGAVLAAGRRGAVGVRGAVAAAQLVHDPRLCHQLCTDTDATKCGQQQAAIGICASERGKLGWEQRDTSFNVIHWRCRGCFLFRGWTFGASGGLVSVAAAVSLHLLAQAAGLLFQARLDLTAPLGPAVHRWPKKMWKNKIKSKQHVRTKNDAALVLVHFCLDNAQRQKRARKREKALNDKKR